MSTPCSEVTTKVCNETHLGVVLIYSKNGMDLGPASHCRRRCEATKSDAARHVVSALCAAQFRCGMARVDRRASLGMTIVVRQSRW